MNHETRAEETKSFSSEPVSKKPYVPPSIDEEEAFETFVLACAELKEVCGINVPKS